VSFGSRHGHGILKEERGPVPGKGEQKSSLMLSLVPGGHVSGVFGSKFLDVIIGSVCRDGELRGAANFFCQEEQELRDLVQVLTFVSKCCKLGRLGGAAEEGEVVKDGCSVVFLVRGEEHDRGLVVASSPHQTKISMKVIGSLAMVDQ
jgi:hypothetical protein